LGSGNPFIQGLDSGIQQLLELRRPTTDNQSHRNVADETLMTHPNINFEQVSELQPPSIPDAVDHCLIHRKTTLPWETSVPQESTD
jgi:hypothetical protein